MTTSHLQAREIWRFSPSSTCGVGRDQGGESWLLLKVKAHHTLRNNWAEKLTMSYCQEGRNLGAEMLVEVQPGMSQTLFSSRSQKPEYIFPNNTEKISVAAHGKEPMSILWAPLIYIKASCRRLFPSPLSRYEHSSSPSPVSTESIACRREVYTRSGQACGSSGSP